jgi:hypothetical protein
VVKVDDGEGDDSDDDDDEDNIEDNDEGGGGNEIDVAEGPTEQNFCANCSPVNSSCGQFSVKHEMMSCLNPSLSQHKKARYASVTHEDGDKQEESKSNNRFGNEGKRVYVYCINPVLSLTPPTISGDQVSTSDQDPHGPIRTKRMKHKNPKPATSKMNGTHTLVLLQ